jgi:protein gp37
MSWPWPNVWIGATICNQEEADRDLAKLLALPAAKRFLSMEPLLGPVDLGRWLEPGGLDTDLGLSNPGLDWLIVGGESGPKARPMHPDWARSLRDQCQAAGVPYFFKQWGEFAPNWYNDDLGQKIAGSEWIDRMGKKLAGRLLDGREWSEVPA